MENYYRGPVESTTGWGLHGPLMGVVQLLGRLD